MGNLVLQAYASRTADPRHLHRWVAPEAPGSGAQAVSEGRGESEELGAQEVPMQAAVVQAAQAVQAAAVLREQVPQVLPVLPVPSPQQERHSRC